MKYFDDDMDELFNKAGRDYPLKTEPTNWDAVGGALHPEEALPAAQRKNGWRRYLPLLLLLLIPLSVYVFVEREQGSSTSLEKRNSVSTIDVDEKEKLVADKSVKSNLIPEKSNKNNPVRDESIKDNLASDHSIINNSVFAISEKTDTKLSLNTNKSTSGISNTKKIINQFSINKNSDLSRWNKFPPYGEFEKVEVNVPVKAQDRSEGTQSVPNAKKKKQSNKRGLYYGITAAPDLSMIKGQKISGTGYSAGIIAGYQLNAHWSVEAGMLWSRKKYYSDGKYFDKGGAQIPWNVYVMWLDGGCNMFEFPLLARYDFSIKKNTFFVAAGLISYMMKKEDYKYGAKVSPSQWYYEGEREYDRSGDHLFSNVQLSAGYKFSLSPKMNIRIEPYLKAPLKKIGIGKMPITSAGVSFGITRDFR